mmetsp:Transcript_59529/g.98686  ORF Transcript_59529/g.98686 Transcript_59529/m.98686 type:complete len:205 (+) Transcript_59529:371-985(+)
MYPDLFGCNVVIGMRLITPSRIWPLSQLINTIVKWDRSSSSSFSLSASSSLAGTAGNWGPKILILPFFPSSPPPPLAGAPLPPFFFASVAGCVWMAARSTPGGSTAKSTVATVFAFTHMWRLNQMFHSSRSWGRNGPPSIQIDRPRWFWQMSISSDQTSSRGLRMANRLSGAKLDTSNWYTISPLGTGRSMEFVMPHFEEKVAR